MTPFIDHVYDIADVDADAAGQARVEVDVGRETVPVAIESEADELSFAIEDRRATVAAGDVVVRQEAEIQSVAYRIRITAEIGG